MRIAFFLLLLTLTNPMTSWSQKASSELAKINGVNFVAPRNPISQNEMKPIRGIAANFVGIVPYAFAYQNQPKVVFDTSRQWWGERQEGAITTIKYAQNLGMKVMIKPHVWVFGQGWPGDFTLEKESDWKEWESQYRQYILAYAKIAEDLDVALFCIGTEYRHAATLRHNFWIRLITDVRKIYAGKITYAANWDNYEEIQFWNYLDYIGIDAYFPLASAGNPSLNELKKGWVSKSNQLQKSAIKWGKPIVFTEYGYQSMDHGAGFHWELDPKSLNVNLELQAKAYQALFETVWTQSWFLGGFLWKWHANHQRAGGDSNKSWTPQNKPAQNTIRKYYSN